MLRPSPPSHTEATIPRRLRVLQSPDPRTALSYHAPPNPPTPQAELRDALADVDAAWRRYTAKMNAPTMADDAARRGVFAANLKAWSAENDKRSDPYLALGARPRGGGSMGGRSLRFQVSKPWDAPRCAAKRPFDARSPPASASHRAGIRFTRLLRAAGLSQFAHLTADEFKKYYLMDTASESSVTRLTRAACATGALRAARRRTAPLARRHSA